MPCVVRSTGSALPEKVITNDDLSKTVDTSHEWIVARTGIHQRHIADPEKGETTSFLATQAAKKALEAAKLSPDDIDLVLVATTTPDYSYPSVATLVQRNLGIQQGAAFDLSAACSGFIYALKTASGMLDGTSMKRALVIGAETFSNLVDWSDRNTCVLFGDGAGAVVLEYTDHTDDERGIIGIDIASDGTYVDALRTSGGVSTTRDSGVTLMNGKEVFKHAVREMSQIVSSMLDKYSVKRESVDWLVPHQANKRIIDATAKVLELSSDKIVLTLDQHANTSAASIPLALDVAVRDGRIKQGDLVFLEAFGAGFTWGGALVRW